MTVFGVSIQEQPVLRTALAFAAKLIHLEDNEALAVDDVLAALEVGVFVLVVFAVVEVVFFVLVVFAATRF